MAAIPIARTKMTSPRVREMIYDWNHDGLQQLTGASRTGALKSTLHVWSPALQFPRHCVKCGINKLVSEPALSSNMGSQLILLHHIGSSYCVAPLRLHAGNAF